MGLHRESGTEAAEQAAQSCVSQRFIPVVEDGIERSFMLQRRQHRAQDRGHPQQRGQASIEADAAKRGEDDQNKHAQAEANDYPNRSQFPRQIRKLCQISILLRKVVAADGLNEWVCTARRGGNACPDRLRIETLRFDQRDQYRER
jgi:hypothetical protein